MSLPTRLCRHLRVHLAGLTLASVALLPAAFAQKPTISRIDPPNWFAALPAPMLLVHGTALDTASFTVSDPAVHITKKLHSANGHWAMVWLDTHNARAETLTLTARNTAGIAQAPYTLAPRRSANQGPAGFTAADVMYLIMPDRFADGDPANDSIAGSPAANRSDPHAYHGGDLQGITAHLDYLQQLGVTALWLTPVVQNDPATSDYHGYGSVDQYVVEPRLGTLADLQHLADELHRRHMKLVFDDVPNHIGPAHPWATDPPMPDWFHGTVAQHRENKYIFNPITDPHAPAAASLDALDGWFVNTLPDMNQANPVVAQYLTQNMIWWIEEAGIDGLRIDTFQYVQRDFWQQYLSTLATLYPHLTSVGEISGPDPTITAYFAGGRTVAGFDTHLTTPFDYPLYYGFMDVLTKGKSMSELEEILRQDWLYPHPEALVPFLGNHDQIRFLSQPGASPALLRLGFGLLMTLRGTPQLYAGDEVLMRGGEDPDNRRDFPGGFPGDPADAFTAAGRTPNQAAMHDWLAALGSLRARTPALQTGTQQTVLAGNSTFAYVRTASPARACSVGGSMLVVINRDSSPATIAVPVQDTTLSGCKQLQPALGDAAMVVSITGPTVNVQLPAFGVEIYSLQ